MKYFLITMLVITQLSCGSVNQDSVSNVWIVITMVQNATIGKEEIKKTESKKDIKKPAGKKAF